MAVKVDDLDNFAEWFKKTRGREYTQKDLDKYESRMKASRLFPMKDQFNELYERYRQRSSATDITWCYAILYHPLIMIGNLGWILSSLHPVAL